MNQQPFAVPPRWWAPNLKPWVVRLLRRHRLRYLKRIQRITQVEVTGYEPLKEVLASGAGMLITPNHSFHFDGYMLFEGAAYIGRPVCFMTSWQLFAMRGWLERWLLQLHGAFSVDREGTDLRAFKQAVDILKSSPYPLAVFPEGDVYHTNDRLTPFRDGAAAMAISAAKRAERPIVVVPTALKAWYLDDPTPKLIKVVETLERRFNWRIRPEVPLQTRVYRLAVGILSLKELEYLGAPQAGPLTNRLRDLSETLLVRMEAQAGIKSKGGIVPERVKEVRRHHIQLLQRTDLTAAERSQLASDMEDLFFVVQLYSYPGDYAETLPTVERLAEIIDKFEEDVLGLSYPTLKGDRRVALKYGTPIPVQPYLMQPDGAHQLTLEMERRVQALLDELNSQPFTAR